jgi:adenylate kinase family enzyme
MTADSLQRVVVIGTSGSGKTTFAAKIAPLLDLVPIDIDQLHWGPNWTPKPKEEFHRLLQEAASDERWVIAGNYGAARDLVWPRATTVIWLNYSFATVFWRALRRTVWRAITQEPVCNGNRESFRLSFFSRDSVLLWVITTFRRRRKEYSQLRAGLSYPHLEWIEFRRPNEAEDFLASLGKPRSAPGSPSLLG